MAVTYRSTKGSALTTAEMDANFQSFYQATDTVVSATTASYCSGIVAGTVMAFYMSAAPSGWSTNAISDTALRVVSSSAGTTGGSLNFSSVFSSRTPTGSLSATASPTTSITTLGTTNLPSHNHPYSAVTELGASSNQFPTTGGTYTYTTLISGSSGVSSASATHSHSVSYSATFSGVAMDFSVAYVDVIICTKG